MAGLSRPPCIQSPRSRRPPLSFFGSSRDRSRKCHIKGLLGRPVMRDDDEMRPRTRQRNIEITDGEQAAQAGKVAQNHYVRLKPFETARSAAQNPFSVAPLRRVVDERYTVEIGRAHV